MTRISNSPPQHTLYPITLLVSLVSASTGHNAQTITVSPQVSGLSPKALRHLPPQLRPRQAESCSPGFRACADIFASSNTCCPSSAYCYVATPTSGTSGSPSARCCASDSPQCADDPCTGSSYYCSVSGTYSCCPRACPGRTNFLCPSSVGGHCCPLNAACGANSQCPIIGNATPTSSQSLNVVSPGVSSTSQTGGATSSASASKSSLSTGIKATIAVAVIVLAAIVAGIAFFIYRHRKQARSIFTGSVGGSAAPNGVAAAGSGRPGPHHARSQSYSTTAAATVRPGMATMDSNRSGQEPRPEPGPYTVGPNDNMHSTSPGVAVPAHPEGPGDFVQPIEIGPGLPKEPEGQPPVELP